MEKMFQAKVWAVFVAGNLEGLDNNYTLTYPVSSLQRVRNALAADIASMRVIKTYGSSYVIRDFEITIVE